MSNCYWVVDIIQTKFWDGRLPVECNWKMVLLIPKRNGKFKGIGLVDVLWKVLSGSINWQIGAAVHLHSVINGFWVV